jgi:beta-ribofuranosylaminobenzene 5'-phosphate synthase
MGLMPAIIEENFELFIRNLNRIWCLGSKKLEIEINKNKINYILDFLNKKYGFAGMSSLGPTCYSFTTNNVTRDELEKILPDCDITITTVNNNPHEEIIF